MLSKSNDLLPQATWLQAHSFPHLGLTPHVGADQAEAELSQDPYGSLAGTHMGSVAVKGLFSLALQTWLMNVQLSELTATSSEICFPAGADSLSQIPTALVRPAWSTGC